MPSKITRWIPPRPRRRETKERAHYQTSQWSAIRLRVLVRDAYTCKGDQCGMVVSGRGAHVDHIVPLEDGGTDHESNLQTLCERCHGRKTIAEQRRKGLISGR